MKQGLILLAHGARDPRWAAALERTAAGIRAQRPALPLQLAYLEHLQPDLDQAADALVAAGCTQIELLPMFIGLGAHLRADLPRRLVALRARHPAVCVRVHEAIAEHIGVQQAMTDCALALLNPESGP